MNPADELSKLLREFVGQMLTVSQFCEAYERAFNLEIDKSKLTVGERDVFQRLFDEVVYYSPFEEDRVNYPGYRNDDQIRQAVVHAMEELKL